ncbi:MAG: M48 family metallopeptidase [Oscillospiraceae bacterium]|nr:M48 family metallopeptidase [Oscillospiraceae bacterium]
MQIEGISAEIRLIRSKRRTLSAEVRSDGSITVRAPLRMPLPEIERFLIRKAAFIERHRQRCLADLQQHQEPPLTAGELAKLAEKAKAVIPQRTAVYADKIGVSYGRITIRCQKTRWGSCSSAGNLNFNCLLMLAPPEVLDSVIVHELCHRLHPNHSRSFYAAVYRAFPDYNRCDRWLRENGPALLRRAGY